MIVVGSANMDVVFSVDRAPSPGETLIAESAARYPGGKGLNQAVAAARAGAATSFVGALGRDENGDRLAAVMTDDGIGTDGLRRVDADSGQAFIVVDGSGENSIVVASGANASVTELDDADREAIALASVLLMQLELPLAVVVEAARVAHEAGTMAVLNAAPAHALPDELLGLLDGLIVNEHEARVISGDDRIDEAAAHLSERVPLLVVTLGAAGSMLFQRGGKPVDVPPIVVDAVDTTGAGDTFCGAFAAAIAEGREPADAAAFASAAASLSVQQLGAVPSIPGRVRIEERLAR